MFLRILWLTRLLVISMSFLLNEDNNFPMRNSVATKMISKLIEESGSSTVYFSNLNSEILNQFVQSHELNITVVVNDFQNISVSEKRKIEVTISHLNSLTEFDSFFNVIRSEEFSRDGHFIIVYDPTDEREMKKIFSKFWKLYVYNVNVLVTKEDSSNLVSMFTYMPFSNGSCNNTKSVQINQFSKISANWTTNVFFPKKFKQMNRCPLRFGGYISYPRFIINTENGVKKLTGVTVDVGTMFGDVLNFTANFIEYVEDTGVVFKNKTATALVKRVMDNEVDAMVTTLQVDRMEVMSATRTLYFDTLVLVVPPPYLIDPMERVLLPFTSASWISIGVVVLLACCVVKVLQFTPKAFHNYVIGKNVKGSMLNVWNIFLGGTQQVLPRSNFPRFLLVKFLIFTLIMRSLYQGRVFDILKRDLRTVELKTVDEYNEHKFTFYIFRTLAANFQGPNIINMSRYETIIDSDILPYCFKTLNASFKGVVFHFMRPIMYHNLMNRKNFTFRICKEVLNFNSFAFYFTKDFYLHSEFDNLLFSFDSAGLIDRIMSKYIDPNSLKRIEKQPPSSLSYSNIQEIFELFYYGCALALLTFICEIILVYIKGCRKSDDHSGDDEIQSGLRETRTPYCFPC